MINLGFTVLAMNAGPDSAILDPTNWDMMGVIFVTKGLPASSAVMFSTVQDVDAIIDDEGKKYGRYDTLKFD